MSKKNLAALVVVTHGALFGIGCTNDTSSEPEVVETEKRADVQVPVPSDDDTFTSTTKPMDACPFTPGGESVIRCPCGLYALATSCDDVCDGVPNGGGFRDISPRVPAAHGGH